MEQTYNKNVEIYKKTIEQKKLSKRELKLLKFEKGIYSYYQESSDDDSVQAEIKQLKDDKEYYMKENDHIVEEFEFQHREKRKLKEQVIKADNLLAVAKLDMKEYLQNFNKKLKQKNDENDECRLQVNYHST